MTVKEYLKQYEEADRLVKQLKIEYEEESEKIDTIRSSVGDGTPHGGSVSNEVETRALRLIDKADKLKRAQLDAMQIRQEIYDTIQKIPGDEGTVLYMRYIALKKFEIIAEEMHFSLSNIYKIHKKARDLVAECIVLQ
ncbi:MAG: sigma-70 family RNA polymerase sigma factor [Clostridiales bacterium]|nr:sigma-70 family RNA polymerase sigma factor [Clostridiales bacterium]